MPSNKCATCNEPWLLSRIGADSVGLSCRNGHHITLPIEAGYVSWLKELQNALDPVNGIIVRMTSPMHKIIAQYQIALAMGVAACLVADEEDKTAFKVIEPSPPQVIEPEPAKPAADEPPAPADFVVYTDGSCHPNPGPAGCGAVLVKPSDPTFHMGGSETLGKKTNNEAEYAGVILGIKVALEYAHKEPIHTLEVRSDSELVVKQLNGEYSADSKFNEFQNVIAQLIDDGQTAGLLQNIKFTWTPGKTNPAHDPAEKAYKECAKRMK